jgi:N-acyl-D-amino-acid deacylase
LLIKDGRIAHIGFSLEKDCEQVISAAGQIVAPGFIDSHSHSDLEVLVDPYLESKVRQGITTEIIGQDGIGPVPAGKDYHPYQENLARITGEYEGVAWRWQTVEDYLRLLDERGIGSNLMTLVPYGNIRMEILGQDSRKPDSNEIEAMESILKRDLQAGAAGLSAGLIYPPCSYASTEELIALCKVVAEFGKVFVVHQRSESDDILDSMREVIHIARESGVKCHFSHFKVCGKVNWPKIEQMESLIDRAHEEEIKISYDIYPYTAGSTTLSVALPPWALEGGTAATLERLKNLKMRLAMAKDIKKGLPGWDNLIQFAGFDGIFITSLKTKRNQDYIGKSLSEIAVAQKQDPMEIVFDLLLTEELKVGMIDYHSSEENLIRFLQRPEAGLCTDGLPSEKPHPRIYGAFPRLLGRYARTLKALTLEEAIHKMTGKTAEVFHLADCGVIKEGNRADLVIFNPETITDTGTFEDPCRYPEGIGQVFINGTLVLNNAERGKQLTGQVIRWT